VVDIITASAVGIAMVIHALRTPGLRSKTRATDTAQTNQGGLDNTTAADPSTEANPTL
jgi:hypothetical protein